MKHERKVHQVILTTVRQHIFLSIGILCSVIAAIAAALLPPMILGSVIDSLSEASSLPLISIILYYVFLALSGITESIREGLLTVFGQKITHALRSSLMDKYTHLTTDELTAQEPGSIVSRFVADVDTVENLFTSGIISMFADACKIISILSVIWFRNRGLSIVLLIMLPFLFVFTRTVQKRMLKAQIDNRRAVGKASGFVPETIRNIRTIHCFSAEDYMEERYDAAVTDSFKAIEKTNFYDAVYSPVILIMNAAIVASVMLFSASGNASVLKLFGMSAGTAVAVINYISQIFTPIESLGMEIQTIQSAVAGVHRINEFYELEEQHDKEKHTAGSVINGQHPDHADFASSYSESEYEDKCTQTNEAADQNGKDKIQNNTVYNAEALSRPCVQFAHVSFAYDHASDHKILSDLSFAVQEGEQLTLAGRTGAGKSTVFKLLLGLYEPQSGKVLINGIPSAWIPASERRRIFGYVEQSFHMVPGTVRDQITLYDQSISENEIQTAAKSVGLDNVIRQFEHGYDTQCTPELFSQGQWQLLSIARAIVADPKLLLLDEITANLDVQTETEVLEALQRSAADRTVISISHRVNARTGRIVTIAQNKT